MYYESNYLEHHGIKGQRWGVRRYQNYDGSYTKAGLTRYQKKMNKRKSRIDKMVAEGKQLNDMGETSTRLVAEAGKRIVGITLAGVTGMFIGAGLEIGVVALGSIITSTVLGAATVTGASNDVARLNAYENHVNGKTASRIRKV